MRGTLDESNDHHQPVLMLRRAVAVSLLLPPSMAVNDVRQPACVAGPGAPALDHAVLVVRDLDRAGAAFATHGFRLKPGRLHGNGLLNRHVKFRDGTSIELMTVRGAPGDELAASYARLLANGEGAVYTGLTVANLGAADIAAARAGLATRRSTSGPARFVSFPTESAAAAVFFGAPRSLRDPDSLVTHRVAVEGLAEVWAEGGPALGTMLGALGATRCGSVRAPDGREGERWALARGHLVIVPVPPTRQRARVMGVVLRSPTVRDTLLQPLPYLWVRAASNVR